FLQWHFQVLALTVVSIGVAVATVTDLQFHFFGACIAVAWIIPSAVNKILWSNLQQEENWTALALMWKTTPITLFFLVMLMPSLDPPGVLSFNWNIYNSSIIGGSAILGFLLQWSGALALGYACSAYIFLILLLFLTTISQEKCKLPSRRRGWPIINDSINWAGGWGWDWSWSWSWSGSGSGSGSGGVGWEDEQLFGPQVLIFQRFGTGSGTN
ncbi:nucleotide-sugar uncharacterized transporter 1-like, partial [Olea europaea var. sylvestris]|uniref:nucleotide-sugar uncharacterized transporter 1-like n=1 Tax=Olea europaea var. sylvestris TaxID=158386 RepID=UPI000C1D8B8F